MRFLSVWKEEVYGNEAFKRNGTAIRMDRRRGVFIFARHECFRHSFRIVQRRHHRYCADLENDAAIVCDIELENTLSSLIQKKKIYNIQEIMHIIQKQKA